MSETDDTDELLVIPPDFFLIPSELETTEPYFNVVNTLITQVNSLQGRVTNIEDSTIENSAVIGGSCDDIYTVQMYHGRSFNSAEDIVGGNKGTPPRDARGGFNSLPSTPSTDRSAFGKYSGKALSYSNPRSRYSNPPVSRGTYNAPTQHTTAYSRAGVSRNLTTEFDSDSTRHNEPHHVTGSYRAPLGAPSSGSSGAVAVEGAAIKRAGVQTLTVEALRLPGDSAGSTLSATESISSQSRESAETAIYRYNPRPPRHISFEDDDVLRTARNLLEVNQRLLGASTKSDDNNITNANESHANTNTNSIESTNSVQGSGLNTNSVCSCNAVRNSGTSLSLESDLIDDAFSSGNLVSLAELFTDRKSQTASFDFVRSKMTEEKFRRLHCEQIIQDLQTKVLELKQRLSIAVELDKNKSDSILKFQQIWGQVANRVQQVMNERNRFEQELFDIQTKTINDLEEAAKKVEHYEKESTKALNSAHTYHDRIVQNDAKMIEILAELEKLKSINNSHENNFAMESKKNMELSKILGQKEIELNDSKKVISDARNEIAQSKQAVEICQGEFTAMKTQYTDLELLLHNKQDAIKHLEGQKKSLCQEIEKLKNVKCRHLEEELAKTRAAADRNKSELREFYQSQLEVVVQEKLAQFQKQLDQAESSLHKEMKNREQTIAETAAQHIQQLSNKHLVEIRLLEQKHGEQLRLQQLQLQQAQAQVRDQHERKSQIAAQLHQMMEAQWREAVRIINNRGNESDESPLVRMERLQEMNSRSRSNLEEMLQLNTNNDDLRKVCNGPETFQYQGYTLGGDTAQTMYETPPTSKSTTVRNKLQIETDLQKCIQMLLNRPVTMTNETHKRSEKPQEVQDQDIDDNCAENLYMPHTDRLKSTNSKSSKRPWK